MDYAFLVIYFIFFMQLIGCLVLSFYSLFNYALDKKQSLNYSLLLLPALMMFTLPMMQNKDYLVELVLIALSLHALIELAALSIKNSISPIVIAGIGVVLPLIMVYSGLLFAIYKLGFALIGIIYIVFILIYAVAHARVHGVDDYIKADFINIISVLALIIMFNDYGLSIMLGLMLLSLTMKAYHLVMLSKRFREELDQSYELIKKDFDEEVRKKVRTQLYYMEQTQERMAEIAKIDAMTGVYNKKALLHALEEKIADNRTTTFTLLIFDIDRFKSINDTYGHIIGDKCIIRVAKAAKESIREGDLVGRYGGDEFFVLLSGADLRMAIDVAHRLRLRVESLEEPKLTVSIGLSNFPADATNLKDLISHADAGLYQAKEKGRNTLGYVVTKKA